MANGSGRIGYDSDATKQAAQNIVDSYNAITEMIKDGWGPVSTDFYEKWRTKSSADAEYALARNMRDVHKYAGAYLSVVLASYIESLNLFLDNEAGISITRNGEEVHSEVNQINLQDFRISSEDYRINLADDIAAMQSAVVESTRDNSGYFDIEDANVAQTLYNNVKNYLTEVKSSVTTKFNALAEVIAFIGSRLEASFEAQYNAVLTKLDNLDSWLDDFHSVLSSAVGVTLESESTVATNVESANQTDPNQEVF